MDNRSTFFNLCLLSVYLIFAIAGIFQFGHLIGLAVYSQHFSFDSITLLQVGLISSGSWGVFEFIRTIKKLTTKAKYN